jgi:hypothetical protein
MLLLLLSLLKSLLLAGLLAPDSCRISSSGKSSACRNVSLAGGSGVHACKPHQHAKETARA